MNNKDFVFDLLDCMTSPIIVFESAWRDSIPEDMLKNVKFSRLIASILDDEMASFTEALVYMMPRTYEAPLPMEWVNIYTWLGLQYAIQFKKKGQVEAALEIAPKELTDYEKGLLNNLRRWIYRQRRKVLKTKLKSVKVSQANKSTILQETLFKE